MAAARWKQKPTGFTTVRKDGWWVRPGDASARPAGTPAAAPRSAAVNKLVPREWQGSQGVLGGYTREPRLDPNRYEWTQNPENNRWFARPRTELTGLDPQMRADVASFDQQGNDQSARIQSSFDQFVREAEANRAATTAGLTGLAGAVGAGYMQSDPTAAALQGTTRATAQASALPVAARLSDAPLVARSEGVSRLQDFLGQRREQRAGLISDYRGQQAEAAAAQAETAAELRNQNLTHLGKVLAGKVDVTVANTRAETATQDRAAKLRIAAEQLRSRADIARQNNQTSRANTLDKLAADREKAAKKADKAKGPSQETRRMWGERAAEMWEGVPRTETERYTEKDASGATVEKTRQVTKYVQYNPNEIVRYLMAQGATRAQALKIMRQVTGQANAGNPTAPVSPGNSSAVGNWLRF